MREMAEEEKTATKVEAPPPPPPPTSPSPSPSLHGETEPSQPMFVRLTPEERAAKRKELRERQQQKSVAAQPHTETPQPPLPEPSATPSTATATKAQGPIREDLVQTAVKFLRNPTVASEPEQRRRAFLEAKQLTAEEIKEAFRRVTSAATPTMPPMATASSVPEPQGMPPLIPPRPSFSEPKTPSWMDFAVAGMSISGAVYGVYKLCQSKLAPLIEGMAEARQGIVHARQETLQQTNDQLDSSSTYLSESVSRLTKEGTRDIVRLIVVSQRASEVLDRNTQRLTHAKGVKEVIKLLESECDVYSEAFRMAADNRAITDSFKQDIRSLKGLLLNHRNFPSPPPSSTSQPRYT